MGAVSNNPISDFLEHGKHPFPADIEDLIRKIDSIQPSALDGVKADAVAWARGENLEAGKAKLRKILDELGSKIGSGLDDLDGLGDLLG